MKCSSCGTEIPGDVAFCPNCGTPARPRPSERIAMATVSGLATMDPHQIARAASTPALIPGKLFAERYVVERKLGEGGMGVVYAARDNNTGEEIALKLIHPNLVSGEEAMKRLVAEGVTARQIRHPNIIAVYDIGQAAGQPYLTMEYVKGTTLRSWMVNAIGRAQEVGVKTAAGIIRAILAGLAEAHRVGIVHRDLSPENILLCGDPAAGDFRLKILDFGIARAVGGPAGGRSSGSGVGKPLYMAPEQITAPDTVGPAADLYAVTAIFYELLMEAVPQGRWELPSQSRTDVPKALDALIERGLMARPRSRFQSAGEYDAALVAALAGPAQPPPAEPVRREPIPPVRKPPAPEPRNDAATAAPVAKKRNWRLITGVIIGGVLIAAGVQNMMERPGGKINLPPPAEPTPQVNYAPPPVAPAAWRVPGIWYDDAGHPFQASHDGSHFSATGNLNGVPLRFDGDLTPQRFVFNATNPVTGQFMWRGDGYVLNENHLSYTFYLQNGMVGARGCFHLNHAPNPPCVNGQF